VERRAPHRLGRARHRPARGQLSAPAVSPWPRLRPRHILALTVEGDPADPRVDDIPGDLTPDWGMHLVDVNVALGDIVDLVARQSAAYAGA
jgi:hypothetical protein